MITTDQLLQVLPNVVAIDSDITEILNAAMDACEIDSPQRQAAFLAVVAHDSGELASEVDFQERASRFKETGCNALADAGNHRKITLKMVGSLEDFPRREDYFKRAREVIA